jgi:putative DNA primase/helicase
MEQDHVTQFADALRAAGLTLKGAPLLDDRIHRVDVEGKPGGKDGSYRAIIEGDRAYGWFQNWLIHQKPVAWHADGDHRLTREQRRHLAQERADRDAERAKALQEQHRHVAETCQALWDAADPVDTHPYLTRKGVPSYGLRAGVAGQTVPASRDDGTQYVVNLEGKLFVPMRDERGKLCSLQYITDDGRKRYHPGGRKEGCHFTIGNLEGVKPICVAEGYATAASVNQLSELPTITAFDSGNLLPVALAYRSALSNRPIILTGDNDHARERETGLDGKPKPNAGKLAALAAANAVGGVAVLPRFAEDDTGSDFNDLISSVGLEAAQAQFRRSLAMAERERQGGKQL